MITAIVIIVIVVGFLVGGLLVLRSSAKTGMPPPDVLERASLHAKELDAAERAEDEKP